MIGGIIKELMVGIVILTVVGVILLPYYNPPHKGNNLCENQYTSAFYGSERKDHGETRANGKDCCFLRDWRKYDFSFSGQATAEGWCKKLAEACKEFNECSLPKGFSIDKNCTKEPSRDKPWFLFDCVESTLLCNNESCVMSCNHNYKCEPGEGDYCPECY